MPLAGVYRFRRTLGGLPDVPRWRSSFSILPFEPTLHALLVYRLLEAGYANGGGEVAGFANWWSALSTDAEYDPGLVFLVGNQDGTPVAAAICWTSAYVKDLVVATGARRQGLATNLLYHIFHAFRRRGATAVDLKVKAENHAAIALYLSVGMTCVETLQLQC